MTTLFQWGTTITLCPTTIGLFKINAAESVDDLALNRVEELAATSTVQSDSSVFTPDGLIQQGYMITGSVEKKCEI